MFDKIVAKRIILVLKGLSYKKKRVANFQKYLQVQFKITTEFAEIFHLFT